MKRRKTIITQNNGYGTIAFVWDERNQPHSEWDIASPHRTYPSITNASHSRLRPYGDLHWKLLPTGIVQKSYHRKGAI